MIAVGNDIVDLKTPEALGKASDIRFIEKVLTAGERRAMAGSSDPDALLWGFWAAKEAAYKVVVKSAPDISSAPGKYAVELDTLGPSGISRGWVRTPLGMVPLMMEWHADFVHVRATLGPPEAMDAVVSGVGRIPEGNSAGAFSISERESLAARNLAAASIATFLGADKSTISIIRPRTSGRLLPPQVQLGGKPQTINLSLSHDGRFAAFAFYHHREHGDQRDIELQM